MNTTQDTKELFEQYSDMVYRIAISYGNSVHSAEDIVQEVFLRYLKKRPCFESSDHEKAWFIRVAVNCCKSLFASAWSRRICPLEDAGQITLPFQPDEDEYELYEVLLNLPPKYRIVLYLRYYEEYQVQEIAGILGITPNLASTRLARAKKLLKNQLSILNERMEFQDETGTI
ncbi:MAG: sigma-70 family RNA polymerase sigma factor [Lachnospiraceae bacterium]|nr:sigma-70 family RNA polymerase sigma factor [Lachnospiraceae bacterium]MDE7274121.1 sigma-70 family RNA polymerase sigma factor [Lachnospiraceae bacterium]